MGHGAASVPLTREDGKFTAIPEGSIASWSASRKRLFLIVAGLAWLTGIGFLAAMAVMRFRGEPL